MNISIITVCFNSEKTIEGTINSVLSQNNFDNIQYIIVDGYSTDATMDIVLKYTDKIDIIISERDRGIYDAMNKGIELATGDIIGMLNSDDVYEDQTVLSDVLCAFVSDVGLDILYGNLVYVKHNDLNAIVRSWKSVNYYKNFFEHGNVPPHPTLFLRASVYDIVGKFSLGYKLASDYEFMLRLFKSEKFQSKYLNRLFIRMRLGGATNKSFKNILNGNIEIYKSWSNNNLRIPIFFYFFRFINRIKQFI